MRIRWPGRQRSCAARSLRCVIERTLDRDHFMSAEQAKAFGIVDHVYETRDEGDTPAAPAGA